MTEQVARPARRSLLNWLGSWYGLRGRATRREFWLLVLAVYGGIAVAAALAVPTASAHTPRWMAGTAYLVAVILLITGEVAMFCTAVRRMHDIGRRGTWVLIVLVPFTIGFFWFLALLCTPSQQTDNEYGPLR